MIFMGKQRKETTPMKAEHYMKLNKDNLAEILGIYVVAVSTAAAEWASCSNYQHCTSGLKGPFQRHNHKSHNEKPPLLSNEHLPPLYPRSSQVGVQYGRPLFRVCVEKHTLSTRQRKANIYHVWPRL